MLGELFDLSYPWSKTRREEGDPAKQGSHLPRVVPSAVVLNLTWADTEGATLRETCLAWLAQLTRWREAIVGRNLQVELVGWPVLTRGSFEPEFQQFPEWTAEGVSSIFSGAGPPPFPLLLFPLTGGPCGPAAALLPRGCSSCCPLAWPCSLSPPNARLDAVTSATEA